MTWWYVWQILGKQVIYNCLNTGNNFLVNLENHFMAKQWDREGSESRVHQENSTKNNWKFCSGHVSLFHFSSLSFVTFSAADRPTTVQARVAHRQSSLQANWPSPDCQRTAKTLNSALYTTSSTADYMGGLEQEVLVMQASIKSNLWATSLRTWAIYICTYI